MNFNPEVDRWLVGTDHPLTQVIQKVREAILSSDPRVEECIKWKSPTFTFRGNIASINPQARQFVSLMFHRGAQIPGEFPNLQGGGEVTRYLRFADEDEVEALSGEIQAIVRSWCGMRGP